ncbi:MAG TPA: deoxyribodipyrimidine photo-lyase [Balneolaceae bacterium]
MHQKLNIFWFRRDLRLDDNTGLSEALEDHSPVLPIFIFDTNILDELPADDARVTFIYETLQKMRQELRKKHRSSIAIYYGTPIEVFKKLINNYDIQKVFTNHDYEPYARQRDEEIDKLLSSHDIEFHTFKDQVIFERDEVVKKDGGPYIVYTPYMRSWKDQCNTGSLIIHDMNFDNLIQNSRLPNLKLNGIGFEESGLKVPDFKLTKRLLINYEEKRDIPAEEGTSRIGPHLRFGTISIRKLVKHASEVENKTYLEELIWREFYMQLLYHHPKSVHENFNKKYDGIEWRNDEEEFERWKTGTTGFPLIDAGMRQLNEIGYMHNRVRMIVGSFLCKDLLIDWRWGEAYFAEKLLDYEMASNVGNWQWVAGTGADAAPYFRIFNPQTQIKKYDPNSEYINQWVDEFGTDDYPEKMVDHKEARKRALDVYKKALEND